MGTARFPAATLPNVYFGSPTGGIPTPTAIGPICSAASMFATSPRSTSTWHARISPPLPSCNPLSPPRKPRPGRPLPGPRSLRGGVACSTNRELLAKHNLRQDGPPRPGCRVISGPFPLGVRNDDPIRYAYNQSVEVRPFEQPLAMALAGVALKE